MNALTDDRRRAWDGSSASSSAAVATPPPSPSPSASSYRCPRAIPGSVTSGVGWRLPGAGALPTCDCVSFASTENPAARRRQETPATPPPPTARRRGLSVSANVTERRAESPPSEYRRDDTRSPAGAGAPPGRFGDGDGDAPGDTVGSRRRAGATAAARPGGAPSCGPRCSAILNIIIVGAARTRASKRRPRAATPQSTRTDP